MDTARYKAFNAAALSGSLTRAAEVLNYTPSGVSQLVRALEDDLNFPLLERSKSGVTLTSGGKLLLPVIQELLHQEDRIHQMAADINGLSVGSVTIAAYASTSVQWLPDVIQAFQRDYPKIQIHLMEGIWSEIDKWLQNKHVDLAFAGNMPNMPYEWIPLMDDPMVAVLPKSHPLANAKSYPLKNCQDEKYIMPWLGHEPDVMGIASRNNLSLNIQYSTMECSSLLAMVERGMGMSILNTLILQRQDFDVAKVPLDPPQYVTLGIVLPSVKKASPATQKFLQYAVKMIKKDT